MSPALRDVVGLDAAQAVRSPAPDSAAGWQRALEAARRLAWFHGASAAAAARDMALPQRPAMISELLQSPPHARVDDLDAASAYPAPAHGVMGGVSATGTGAASSRTAQATKAGVCSPSTMLLGASGTAAGAALIQGARVTPSLDRHLAPTAVGLPANTQATRLARSTVFRVEAVPPAERLQVHRAEAQVRIHVEETPQGLAVWLGLDADAAVQGARTAALVAELRRLLANSGQRLAAVICNGTPVGDDAHLLPTPHQEP